MSKYRAFKRSFKLTIWLDVVVDNSNSISVSSDSFHVGIMPAIASYTLNPVKLYDSAVSYICIFWFIVPFNFIFITLPYISESRLYLEGKSNYAD